MAEDDRIPDERESVGDRARTIAKNAQDLIASFVAIEKRDVSVDGETSLEAVAKLSLTAQTGPLEPSNVLPNESDKARIFSGAQAILPPYDPVSLSILFEHSNALGANVDAYKTNIESFGYHFEPVIDLDSNDAAEKIGDAMFLERLHAASADEVPQAAYPTGPEIANRSAEIKALMRLEKAKLVNLFDEAVPGSSFVELREQTRVDVEVTGNAFWEVIRNGRGDVAQFTFMPAHGTRLLPLDRETIDVREKARVSALSYEETTRRRRFRRFVQYVLGRAIYFKEYGDPRVMSARTGLYYDSSEQLERAEPYPLEATEVIHFKVFSPRTPYGVPRWIGNLLAVMGSRASEEVNYIYFDNKAVPPLAVLVSGGKLAPDATKKLEEYVNKNLKGRRNFHRILILEAEPSASAPGATAPNRVKIELTPLGGAQQKDGLFQEYDQNNIQKIGTSFRNPPLLRGDSSDINRATADAALTFAELQVYQPLRSAFDRFVDHGILRPSGVCFWRFVSNGPIVKDPTALSTIVAQLTQANILTPGEARVEASGILNRELKKIDAEWTTQPTALTLAGILPDGMSAQDVGAGVTAPAPDGKAPAPAPAATVMTPEQRQLASVAIGISRLRDSLTAASTKAAERIAKEDRRAFDDDQTITIELTRAEMDNVLAERDE